MEVSSASTNQRTHPGPNDGPFGILFRPKERTCNGDGCGELDLGARTAKSVAPLTSYEGRRLMLRKLAVNAKTWRVLRDWCLVGITAGILLAVYSTVTPVAASWFHRMRPARTRRPEVVTGEVVSIAGVTFGSAPQTIVLLTSPTCPHCV